MPSERIDEKLLVRYLLGELSEPEQAEVEDRAFADPAYLNALDAAEADLIDAYVRGELRESERRAFERRFFTSPGRRGKVEFARALATLASELKADETAAAVRPPFWRSLFQFRFAAALAALVCTAGLSWLAFQNSEFRARTAALERQLSREQGRARTLAAELQKQREPAAAAPAPTPVIAALVLLPGLSRAENRRAELVLNPGAQLAHIEIRLEVRDDFPRFRAELRSRAGEEILALGNLPVRRASAGNSVGFDVPAAALPAGDYELALKGIAPGRPAEDIGYYYFNVRKP